MTKELMDFEYKEITCGSSNSSNSFDDYSSFQQKIVEEEEKLLLENVKSELKEEPCFAQEANYDDNFKTDEEIARDLRRRMEEVEIKERKYKSLIDLLNSSQTYSVLLRDKLNQDEEISRKKGRPAKDKNLSSSNQTPGKSYKLGDVITKKNIDETVSINETKEPEDISFVCHLIGQDTEGPFLVVAPISTLHNWASEFKRFAPKVPTLVYHGSEAERMDLRAEIYKKHKVLNKSVQSVYNNYV